MKLLQIGERDWSQEIDIPDGVEWCWLAEDQIESFLYSQEELGKPGASQSKSTQFPIQFDALLLTSTVKEASLAVLSSRIEAHSFFVIKGVRVVDQTEMGFCRQKVLRELPDYDSPEELLSFLKRNLFAGQYGAKLKLHEIDISPNFTGDVHYDGHVGIVFEGEFGEDFSTLYTFRMNLLSAEKSLELWPEYIKFGDCQVRLEVTGFVKGSIGEIEKTYIIDEEDLQEPYVLECDERIGYYSVSLAARGSGQLTCGATHWRYSREGLGHFILGGRRHVDTKRQEIFSYFNPGDLKPPLNVYFSGFRGAEGFEGYSMMKKMGAPFLLLADPRLEGGCFYSGTDELEKQVKQAIQDALDYLGFGSDQLILSGLSMGAFGATYYAAHFQPQAVVVGKPFTNLGDMVADLKLKRPDEFESSSDMMRNVVGGSDQMAIESFNRRFWDEFGRADFEQTKFAIAYMEQDDYDGLALDRLVDYLAETGAHIFAKGYEGRHNDNSLAINRWFKAQYRDILRNDFGRGN